MTVTVTKTWDVLRKHSGEVWAENWKTSDPLAYGLCSDEVAYCRETGEVAYWDNGKPVRYRKGQA